MEIFPFLSSAGGRGTMKVSISLHPQLGGNIAPRSFSASRRGFRWRFHHKTTLLGRDVQVAPKEHLRWPHISSNQGWKLFKGCPNGGFFQTELWPNLQPAGTIIKNPSIKPHPPLSALQILNICSLTQNKCCYIL